MSDHTIVIILVVKIFFVQFFCVVKGAMAAWAQEGLEELSHVEDQEGSGEEIPLVQGKEQWLRTLLEQP